MIEANPNLNYLEKIRTTNICIIRYVFISFFFLCALQEELYCGIVLFYKLLALDSSYYIVLPLLDSKLCLFIGQYTIWATMCLQLKRFDKCWWVISVKGNTKHTANRCSQPSLRLLKAFMQSMFWSINNNGGSNHLI